MTVQVSSITEKTKTPSDPKYTAARCGKSVVTTFGYTDMVVE
jgi:hypothetical protein